MKIDYEINIDETYADVENCDEWGCAEIWINDCIGVEYNYCVETYNGEKNCPSAFYKMEYDKKNEYVETDSSTFKHYEIDFSDPEWRKKLIIAGTTYAMELFLL